MSNWLKQLCYAKKTSRGIRRKWKSRWHRSQAIARLARTINARRLA